MAQTQEEYQERLAQETIDDFDLTGLLFFELVVRYVDSSRIDKVVFAHDPKEANVHELGGYLRAQHYYMHSKRDYGDTPLLERVNRLDHLRDSCVNLNPPYELEWKECDCLNKIFERCCKGSLNRRRSKEARERLFSDRSN